MKTFAPFFLLILFGFFGCQTEQNQDKKTAVSELKNTPNFDQPGIIPRSHEFFDILWNNEDYSLDDLDQYYKTEVAENEAHFTHNLKHRMFLELMHKGLAEQGTPEQKKYYLDEQMEMKNNLPTITDFHVLLKSYGINHLTFEECMAIRDEFLDKNDAVIEAMNWSDPAMKKDKIDEIAREVRSFNKYFLMEHKKANADH
ncbi:MAG: hypothetical protein ABR595_06260 [Psychroflexus sp.]